MAAACSVASASGLPHGGSLFSGISFCCSISQSSSYLAVLCKVKSCNLFCLLNLLFVALDLALELVDLRLHSFMILLILITGKSELLDSALRFTEILKDVSIASALCIQLGF